MKYYFKKKIYRAISNIYPNKKIGNFVLTYHSIVDSLHNLTSKTYQLSKKKFLEQLSFLKINNFKSNFIENLFSNKNNFLITFDDGYSELHQIFSNILMKFNYKIIIFVCPKFIINKKKGYLNKNQIIKMSKNKNIIFGSHTYNHTPLTQIDKKHYKKEIVDSKMWIEDLISKPVKTFSFPYGLYNLKLVDYLKNNKYEFSFTTKFGSVDPNTDPFLIPRLDIWNDDNLNDLKLKIEGKYNWLNFFKS